MADSQTQRFYYPELDGLRFFAFLLVFIHNGQSVIPNSPLKVIAEHGWIGVDLFFCLSAFLLTKLLVFEYQKNNTINPQHFYARRILRIWPLYFLYIAICLVYLFFADTPKNNLGLNLLGLTTFSYNFVYFLLLPSPILVFIHLWSISFEEQFYLLIPWFIKKWVIIKPTSRWKFLLYPYLAACIVRAILVYKGYAHPTVYILPFGHFDSIFFGITIGSGILESTSNKVKSPILLSLGFAVILLTFLLPSNEVVGWHLLLIYPLVGVGSVLILMAATAKIKSFVHKFLSSGPFVMMGRISYGLYVFQILSFILGARIMAWFLDFQPGNYDSNHPMLLLIALTLDLVISASSYMLFEKWFLRLKKKFI